MSAIISDCQKYRYRLERELVPDPCHARGPVTFVMLNPSTADATQDDPTIRRCIGYANAWDATRLIVVNLFAYRSTSPDALYGMSRDHAIGPENDRHIAEACNASRIVVCAWGNHGALFGRAADVLHVIRAQQGAKPKALKINGKSGQPAHPLYLKATLTPFDIGDRSE